MILAEEVRMRLGGKVFRGVEVEHIAKINRVGWNLWVVIDCWVG